MPENETVVRAKSCKDEQDALKEANGNLTEAKQAYDDAIEDYTSSPWKTGGTIAGVAAGTELGLGGILLAGEAASGPIGWVLAGLTVFTGAGATYSATKSGFEEEAKQDRAVAKAYEAYLDAMFEVETAQEELDHCHGDNTSHDQDDDATDDSDDDMPAGDADEPDFMPLGSDDLDTLEDNYSGDDSEAENVIVECEICGYEGPIVDFEDENNPVCPYCESDVTIGD